MTQLHLKYKITKQGVYILIFVHRIKADDPKPLEDPLIKDLATKYKVMPGQVSTTLTIHVTHLVNTESSQPY